MTSNAKYLVTVDSETGAALRIEQVGAAGELTEVPVRVCAIDASGAAATELEFPSDLRDPGPAALLRNTLRFAPQPAPREVTDARDRAIQYWGPERPVLGPREGHPRG